MLGERCAVRFADEIIVLSRGVRQYFRDVYGRETIFIPNGVTRPELREAELIADRFGLEKDGYILFLGRLVPEKGIHYLIDAFRQIHTDKKLVIAGGTSDTARAPRTSNAYQPDSRPQTWTRPASSP
jgi:glycosyltransferase involved in cell wall biosynthesis